MNQETLARLLDECPFHRLLGLSLESVDAGTNSVTLSMAMRLDLSRSEGKIELHGGVTATLIDVAGSYAVALAIGRTVPTINLRVDYLRMGRGAKVFATARTVKVGRMIATVDIDVVDETGRHVAVGRGTYSTA